MSKEIELAREVAGYLIKSTEIRKAQADPVEEDEDLGITEKQRLVEIKESLTALLEIARELSELTDSWNPVEIYTADSGRLAQEKSRLLTAWENNESYNPLLQYSRAEQLAETVGPTAEKLYDLASRVRRFDLSDAKYQRQARLFRSALYAKIKDDIATCRLILGIAHNDEAMIRQAVQEKYPPLDESLRIIAHQNYEALTRDEGPVENEVPEESTALLTPAEQAYIRSRIYKAPEIKAAFEWALREFGILRSEEQPSGFQVVIDDGATSIDVRDKSAQGPTILIPSVREVDGERLLGLLAHEIGAHARQSMNGEQLFGIGGGSLKVDDETLYEGLAMRYEAQISREMFGTAGSKAEGPSASPYYALAVERAEAGGTFYDVFTHMLDIQLHVQLKIHPDQPLPSYETIDKGKLTQAKNEAWRITYRVMRGHTDMTNPLSFAMTKDLAYLRGRQMDVQLQAVGAGSVNEAAIIGKGGLLALAEFNITEETLPIPYQNMALRYWNEIMKPEMPKE